MDLQKIAKLSHLSFSEEEQSQLSEQLKNILAAFDRIKGISTDGVEPLITPVEIQNELRPDENNIKINTDDYIELAPEASGRLYKVPRVIS